MTVADQKPMPTAEELIQKLSKENVFSLNIGHWQVKVAANDVNTTEFVTSEGHNEFIKMPFGMVNSGVTLKRGLQNVLRDVGNVVCYWDDIVVYKKWWEKHIKTLRDHRERGPTENFVLLSQLLLHL